MKRVELSDRVEYRLNGKLHRVDGPAIDLANGNKCWYLNGKRHRVDGPAMEWANGDKEWYLNGKRHRVDGPAMEWANGDKFWYLNGKRHRVNGPAVEWSSGNKIWYINGFKMDQSAHRQFIYNRFRSLYRFAYEFPGGVDAGIKHRLLGLAGMRL